MTASRKRGGALPNRRAKPGVPTRPQASPSPQAPRADSLLIPLAFAGVSFIIFLITRAGFHTFDGIAYVRDMGKPLAALVLPHHLIYEPLVLGFFRVWQSLGWTGQADAPAQVLSSLAGAGGLAIFYKLAWEWSRSRIASIIATLALALTYGYWFYSVEVDIYLPPLFFLLLATWLLSRIVLDRESTPVWLFYLIGLAHAMAVLFHQAILFVVPAFALGLWLIRGEMKVRLLRLVRYGLGIAGVVIPAYLFAGMVVAGQATAETFMGWINSYGNLGTWGVLSVDTPANTLSGISAALSSEYWTGRVLVVLLFGTVLALAAKSIRRGGAFAWALWAWTGLYVAFFAWWQPEVLKFWVLVLPAPILLITMSLDWEHLLRPARVAALSASGLVIAALLVTNAPAIWAKRDPLSDPARQVSDALSRLTGPEDLIVLQASGAEHYLPFYYDRINIMSTREQWYLFGGASARSASLNDIRQRAWHALAKGASVWVEDRVLTPGEQTGDHYVFSESELVDLLNLYGAPATPEPVSAGPSTFYKLSPAMAYSSKSDWQFLTDRAGWTAAGIANETFSDQGWCFAPLDDPNLYGPPLRLDATQYSKLEINMNSGIRGDAQLFYREDHNIPYSEEKSIQFENVQGEQIYSIPLDTAPGWSGTIAGIRFDPVERAVPSATENRVCIRRIQAVP